MAPMKYSTIEELEDRILGVEGTPRRDAFEAEVKEEIRAWHVGEAIKEMRKEKNLTQEQLGELMGVKKAQISKIESGRNVTLSTIARAFHALGVQASLQLGKISVAL